MLELYKGWTGGILPLLTVRTEALPYYAINANKMEFVYIGDFIFPTEAWLAAREQTEGGKVLMMPATADTWADEARKGRTITSLAHHKTFYVCWDDVHNRPQLISPNAPSSHRPQ